ncbi:MAG: ABC transporter substrate-binding protein, partial [Clostridium sp.]|nr:ABC transporter substrate-binding protein [Clostridium sp.]
PDIVIASAHFSEDVYEKLNELEVKVIVLNPNDSFEGVYRTIETLGQIVDTNHIADELVNGMKTTVEEVEKKVSGLATPSVYYVVGFGEFGDFTAGGGTFISEMIKRANGNNIADDVEGWSYSLEKVVEHDPEIVVISKYFDAKNGFVATNGYKDLTAVKEDNVFEIDNNLIDRQGPRLAQGFEALARIIHPDAFK